MITFSLHVDESELPALHEAVDRWKCVGAKINYVERLDSENPGSALKVEIQCDDAATAFYIGRYFSNCKRGVPA